ncbi:MAG TPA: hypothetical protein VED37_02050 [Ktedonobacteraceae bacterium]|nr:hypothetical protein [Ktedonobacteraceae bacterium]
MITCKRCGELVQVGLANCQRCGMPLFSDNQRMIEPKNDFQGPSELPTWLESLRVNERSNSPVSDQSHFSMSDLIDEGALPSWLRPENAEMMEKGNSGKYPAWRPASMSAPQTDEGNIPPGGFPARSLIDEQSLPSWVHTSTGPMPVTPDSQRNFSAASLIQPDVLPDWMKSLPQSPQPFVPQSNVWGEAQSPASHVHLNANTPDPAHNSPNLHPPSFQNQHSGLNASSLLDSNSLPTWLREENHMQTFGSGQSGQASTGNSGLAGSSLIDTNAVPGWLRAYDDQQQTNIQSMGNMQPHPSGTSPRVENVRVPSRPRAEIVPQEQSEVAANVFSSVLGVASSAPYFPSTGTGSQWQAPAQEVKVPSQGLPNAQPLPPAGMQWNAPVQPAGIPGVPPAQGYSPAIYQGGQQVVQPAGENVNYLGMPQQQPMGPGTGMPMGTSMGDQQSHTNISGSKPVKRGFLDTIRSWFK